MHERAGTETQDDNDKALSGGRSRTGSVTMMGHAPKLCTAEQERGIFRVRLAAHRGHWPILFTSIIV